MGESALQFPIHTLNYWGNYMLFWLSQLKAEAASFDCNKANSRTSKLICSNVELSKLDEIMSVYYKGALKKFPVKGYIEYTQKKFLEDLKSKSKNVKADDEFTRYISQSYSKRNLELAIIPDVWVFSDVEKNERFDVEMGHTVVIVQPNMQSFFIDTQPTIHFTTISIFGGATWHNLAEAFNYCQFEYTYN